jgi:protein TonB
MKKIVSIFFFFVFLFSSKELVAQTTTHDTLVPTVFDDPEIPPVFKDGGELGMRTYIKENLRYPTTGDCIQGKVYVGFTVDTLGNVINCEVLRGITKESNEEAVKVVQQMKFIPGKLDGQLKEMKMVVPISFTLEIDDEE